MRSGEKPWWSPGPQRVADGVHRIALPIPTSVHAVNVYALDMPEGLVMVDAGWSSHPPGTEALSDALAELGAGMGDIARFVVTHVHRDHYSYAVQHRAEHGSRVALGAGEQPSLAVFRSSKSRPTQSDLEELRRLGAPDVADRLTLHPVDPAIWEEPDEWLDEGPVPGLDGLVLTARATPGHTRGHLMFIHETHGLAFTGDHVLPLTVPAAGLDQAPVRSPLDAQLQSLAAVLAGPDHRLLPAHGPVSDSVHARATALVRQLEQRVERCRGVVDAELSTREVASRMSWSRARTSFDDLPPMEQRRALTKVAAYLEHLVDLGRLTRRDRGPVSYYRPA